MRGRIRGRENKTKITVSIDKEIKTTLEEFVKEAKNPKNISNSSVIEDVLDYVLNKNMSVLDELFPKDKRFQK